LFSATDVYLAVHGALQNRTEVAKRMFYLFQVDRLGGEVFQVMHDDLLPVGHEHCDPVVFAVLFKRLFCLLNFGFYLLETG
jgi:hypothetical protein